MILDFRNIYIKKNKGKNISLSSNKTTKKENENSEVVNNSDSKK